MVDLPRRLTGYAEQKGDVVLAADWQQYGWLDLDRPRTAADVASVPDLGAAESGRRETAVEATAESVMFWVISGVFP
jgi:hypothetical protein